MYLGVDPGYSGALAVVDAGGELLAVARGDAAPDELVRFVLRHRPTFAALEEVNPKPRIDAAGERIQMGAKSAFTFGRSYGSLEMLLVGLRVPFDRVLPAVWQAGLRCRKADKKMPQAAHKKQLKARAAELFPRAKVTLWNADALLLAEWCRRCRVSQPAGAAAPR